MKSAVPICFLPLAAGLLFSAAVGQEPDQKKEQAAAKAIRNLGGTVFLDLKTGRVNEVNLNGNEKLRDEDLGQVALFTAITDLSLEKTKIGDAGAAKLAGLKKLQWLNLYRTRISDKALVSIARIESLTHLPIGETTVTDAGLTHLAALPNLEYLGLRENKVGDKGVNSLSMIRTLTGLHLGGTAVTDSGLDSILKLPGLEELWLSDTGVTDAGLKKLIRMSSLKRLHLQRSRTSAKAVKALRTSLPDCEIFWESDPK